MFLGIYIREFSSRVIFSPHDWTVSLTPWPPHANEQKVKARDASHERNIQKRRAGASARKTEKNREEDTMPKSDSFSNLRLLGARLGRRGKDVKDEKDHDKDLCDRHKAPDRGLLHEVRADHGRKAGARAPQKDGLDKHEDKSFVEAVSNRHEWLSISSATAMKGGGRRWARTARGKKKIRSNERNNKSSSGAKIRKTLVCRVLRTANMRNE